MELAPVAITLRVAEALEALGVRYFVTGSLASAIHGLARSTIDVDLVADLRPGQEEAFRSRLGDEFYADVESIRKAVHRRASFNLIHQETMYKVDVFVSRARPFDNSRFERRSAMVVAIDPERKAFVATAEDVVLAKLEWYQAGGRVSERQWRDVLGVLSVQAGRLDLQYLRQWASELGVADLLEQALSEAGGERKGYGPP
jgi:hypothetical protein